MCFCVQSTWMFSVQSFILWELTWNLNLIVIFEASEAAEATEVVDNGMLLREQKLALDKSFHNDLKSVLPIKKVLKFHKAQRKFKRKLLKRMKGGGKHQRGQNRNREHGPMQD